MFRFRFGPDPWFEQCADNKLQLSCLSLAIEHSQYVALRTDCLVGLKLSSHSTGLGKDCLTKAARSQIRTQPGFAHQRGYPLCITVDKIARHLDWTDLRQKQVPSGAALTPDPVMSTGSAGSSFSKLRHDWALGRKVREISIDYSLVRTASMFAVGAHQSCFAQVIEFRATPSAAQDPVKLKTWQPANASIRYSLQK
jgi:hypothetical protein